MRTESMRSKEVVDMGQPDGRGISRSTGDKRFGRPLRSLALGLGAGPAVIQYLGATGTPDILPYAAVSTFSGWSSAIGIHQGFNRIVVEIHPDDANDLPHHIRARVRETSTSGTILGTTSVYVRRVAAGSFIRVFLDFPEVIENSNGAPLVLELNGNGIFRVRPITPVLYATPPARYATSQTNGLAVWATASNNLNIYAEFYIIESTNAQHVYYPERPIAADSTFAGWGWLLGQPEAFDQMEITLRIFNAAVLPKSARFVIRENDHTGTILGEVTVPMSVAAPSVVPVYAQFRAAMGDGSAVLWAEMLTDGYVIPYGTSVGVPATPMTRYSIGTNVRSVLNQQVVSNSIPWCHLTKQAGISYDLVPQEVLAAVSSISSAGALTPYTPQFAFAVPPYLYAVEGREANAYFDGLARAESGIDWSAKLDVTCPKGKQERERWTYVPGASDAGTYPWSIVARWNNTDLATSGAKTLRVADSTAGGGVNRKVCVITDSTGANNVWIDECASLFATDPDMDVSFIGSKGIGANKHEGISGWTINLFYSSDGSGSTPASPFVFGGAFNFGTYLSTNAITMGPGDWVIFNLGINDVFNYATNTAASAGIATMGTQLSAMIANVQAAVPGVRIGLGLTIPPARTQDAFGNNYDSNQIRSQYLQNIGLWREFVLANWGASEGSGIYLVPFSVAVDSVNNFPTATTAFNARNAGTFTKQNNGVHPDTSGYYQMADCGYAFLKWHS
ncbi:MAG: hypothetical protein ACO1SV_00735 [Fimbriimonas sp.]